MMIKNFLSWLFSPAPTGFGSAGMRRHRICGAVTLVNLSGFVWGIASDETAINVSRFRCVVEPEFKSFLPDKQNLARGFAVASPKVTVDAEGEISGSTGIMAASVVTAGYTPANSTSYWGSPSTGLYLDRGEVDNSRDNFKRMSASLSAYAGIP